MKTMYIGNLLALSALVCFAKKDEVGQEAPAPEAAPKTTKSIVPSGWKSKGDELSAFINEQCTGKEGFEYTALFALCRKNGLDEAKIANYEGIVASKAHGGEGRAKMTLRNMLATPARKNGKLIALDGSEVAISIAKPAVSGAAAKAKENAAGTDAAAA